MGTTEQIYDQDFYAWAMRNAELIRQGRIAELDLEHIAEELENMGGNTRRELISRLAVLVAHLLRWQFQPVRRGNSWKLTVANQRDEIQDLLEQNPSLRHEIDKKMGKRPMSGQGARRRSRSVWTRRYFLLSVPLPSNRCWNRISGRWVDSRAEV